MSILESLKNIEKKSFLEDKPYLGLVNLYEGIGNKLDSREKNELKKLVSNTDDPDVIKAFLDAKVDDDRHNPQANKAPKPTFEALYKDSEPMKWKLINHVDDSGVEVVDSYTLNYLGYEAEVSEYGPGEWQADLFNSNTKKFISVDDKRASQIYYSSKAAMKKIEAAIKKDMESGGGGLSDMVRTFLISEWLKPPGGISDSKFTRIYDKKFAPLGYSFDEVYDEFERQMMIINDDYLQVKAAKKQRLKESQYNDSSIFRISKKVLDDAGISIDDLNSDITISVKPRGEYVYLYGCDNNVWNLLHTFDLQYDYEEVNEGYSKDLNNDDAPLTEGAKPKAWYESHDYINYLSQKGLPVEGRFYDEIKYVNGFPVIDSCLSSEHTSYRGGWAGYAWYSVDENGKKVDYFYPVYVTNKSEKILLKDPTAWNFIKDSGPLPELSE